MVFQRRIFHGSHLLCNQDDVASTPLKVKCCSSTQLSYSPFARRLTLPSLPFIINEILWLPSVVLWMIRLKEQKWYGFILVSKLRWWFIHSLLGIPTKLYPTENFLWYRLKRIASLDYNSFHKDQSKERLHCLHTLFKTLFKHAQLQKVLSYKASLIQQLV